jgi:uncharacterized membrane protein YkvA (DUF1232 family)
VKYGAVIALFAKSTLSPEQIAPFIGISNMTYRRWMKKDAEAELSLLHQVAVKSAVEKMKQQNLLPADAVLPDTEVDATGASFTTWIRSAVSSLPPASRSGGFESLALGMLHALGNQKNASLQIEKARPSVTAFLAKNSLIGSFVHTLWTLATEGTAPAALKAIACGALLYFVTPWDLIPDFMLGLGFLDDYGVLTLAAGFCTQSLLVSASSTTIGQPDEPCLGSHQR